VESTDGDGRSRPTVLVHTMRRLW